MLAANSADKLLPCSLSGGLAPFIEPWLGEALRARLVPCELDAVHGALLMIRQAVPDRSGTKPTQVRWKPMSASNPYQTLVAGFARTLEEGEAVDRTHMTPPAGRPSQRKRPQR